MRLLGLFDKYFLILMIIQGLILLTDSKGFLKWGMKATAKKSRIIGIGLIIISIILNLITRYMA